MGGLMKKSSIGVIVASHGTLGEVLVETTGKILGHQTDLQPFSFLDGEEPKDSYQRLQSLIKKCDKGSGVLILVDLFGGTPGSLALSMLDDRQIEVVTGVNLPMTMTAATLDPKFDLHAASAAVVSAGSNSIKDAGRLLKQ